EKVRELGLKTVLTLEGTNHSLAETIVKNSGTDAQILYMDSMQSVTSEDVKNGADYLAIMEKNLDVLKKALN
ncbi:MAG: zinc ABC transporter substrate-binding protein, partial [Clostridia bacterium]|nr:zinc ABC transporter substrate-binding protein [Clostridia bacterium]